MIGVCIVTYNQEKYIAQAIESVLMQVDCGHKVVVYVGEDNSTDKTGEICDAYARRVNDRMSREQSSLNDPLTLNDGGRFEIKVIHNEKNLGLVGNTMNLLDIMRKDGCDYIAMLDGDDFWSDPKKLQKQMAYFDAHPDYGLVHTCIDLLYPDKLIPDKRTNYKEGYVFDIIQNYAIGNCSVIFKTELLKWIDFTEFQHQGLRSCDYTMYAIFSKHVPFGFLSDHTAVWRRGIETVSGTSNIDRQINYVQNDLAHWRYLSKLFPERWAYTQQDAESYLHICTFNIAFRFCDKARALQEIPLSPLEFRKKYRIKIFCSRSRFLMRLWHVLREKRVKSIPILSKNR